MKIIKQKHKGIDYMIIIQKQENDIIDKFEVGLWIGEFGYSETINSEKENLQKDVETAKEKIEAIIEKKIEDKTEIENLLKK